MKNAFKKNETEIKTLFVWEKRFSKETLSILGETISGETILK